MNGLQQFSQALCYTGGYVLVIMGIVDSLDVFKWVINSRLSGPSSLDQNLLLQANTSYASGQHWDDRHCRDEEYFTGIFRGLWLCLIFCSVISNELETAGLYIIFSNSLFFSGRNIGMRLSVAFSPIFVPLGRSSSTQSPETEIFWIGV